MEMKILIVDDDSKKIENHQAAIRAELGIEVKAILPSEFGDGTEWKDHDIIAIDYQMEPDGPTVASRVRETNSEAIIIGNSIHWDTDDRANELTDYRARSMDTIVAAIRTIMGK